MTPKEHTNWPPLRIPVTALAVLCAALALFFLLRLSLGTVRLPISSILGALAGTEPAVPTSIVAGYRLPRALAAMISGAAMAVGGLQMQTLLRNPLAGPWILGVVGSARLGVASLLILSSLMGMSLSTTLGPLESSALAIGAIAGAAAGMSIIAALSRRISSVTLLITGVIATYIADSGAKFLVALAPRSQKAIFTAWNDGSFDHITWPHLRVYLAVVLIALIVSVGLVKVLDALILGDRCARSLGLAVARARFLTVIGIVVLAGSVTAFCGPIAFIDIAVPHLARGLFRTAMHKVLLPATALLGSLVALIADLATSLPGAQQVLHINHVSAIVGGPVILWILLRRRENRQMQI